MVFIVCFYFKIVTSKFKAFTDTALKTGKYKQLSKCCHLKHQKK